MTDQTPKQEASCIFEPKDTPIAAEGKRPINGIWRNFMWVPGLTVNGETCMSTYFCESEGVITEVADELVERIRLAWIKGAG